MTPEISRSWFTAAIRTTASAAVGRLALIITTRHLRNGIIVYYPIGACSVNFATLRAEPSFVLGTHTSTCHARARAILTSLSETSITRYHAINSSIIPVPRAYSCDAPLDYLCVWMCVFASKQEREIRFVKQSSVRWNCTNTEVCNPRTKRARSARFHAVSIKVRISENRVACNATVCILNSSITQNHKSMFQKK